MPEILDLREQRKPLLPSAPPAPPPQKAAPAPLSAPKPLKSPSPETAPLSWQAPEYREVKKASDWYWAVGILTLGLFVVAVILQNMLFAFLVLLAGFTVAMYGARPARTVTFVLSPEGVEIAGRLYPYETLKSFWIFYSPPDIKELSIESHRVVMPLLRLPLGSEDPTKVRAYLKQFLPEEQQEESLTDTVARYMKF